MRAALLPVCLASVASPPALSESPAPLPVLEDFLGKLDVWNPELSPNGDYLAVLRQEKGADYIVTLNLDAPGESPKPVTVGDYYVNWLEWANADTVLVATTGYIDLNTGRPLSRKDIEDETPFFRRSHPYSYRRLISIDIATQKMAVMFGDDWRLNRSFQLGSVTDFLPSQPDYILMPARLDGDLDLFKVNVRDGSFERIATGASGTARWFTDRNGEPAFRLDLNRRGTVASIYAREDLSNGKTKWRKTRSIRIDRDERDEAAKEFDLLYPGPTANTYYVAARPDTEDKTGIYLYDFEKDEILQKIRVHDRVDITGALFNRDTRTLLGVYYYDDKLEIEMQDETTQAHLEGLQDYFGDQTNVMPIDSSDDGKRWLLRTSGPTDPGSYHLYSVDTASNASMGAAKTSLLGKRLAPAQAIDYEARDGTALRGYLTRPAGAAPGAPLPLIIMPHGGPEARSGFNFDWQVQLLASFGYQVFEPNFRGSSGFGKTFADKGRRQWGKAMQTDLDDAYSHLVETGLARAGQACIFGYSYGGYAALAAATLTPDQYACHIAGAAPSDLVKMLTWERKEEGSDSEAYLYWVEHMGHPSKDKADLEAVSPARLASRISRPVMLIHGEDDYVVPIEQSELMEKAMKKAGKPVEFIRLVDAGHSYRSDADERTEFEAIRRFLAAHLPAEPQP
jgi:dipeptidyl aminopeptidase/acylaminoacyl peptidase